MGLFTASRRGTDDTFARSDRGMGHLSDYTFELTARHSSITMVLAGSDAHQDELRGIVESGEPAIETAMPPRSIEQERTDDRIQVRLFTGRRVSGPVGSVPRGLESIVDETLRRLDDTVGKPRIPARIIGKPGSYRVELLMGLVR